MKSASFQANPTNTIGAGQNWGVYDWCNQFLQQSEELEEAACAVIAERAAVNVVHCEVRFCPALHTQEGLSEAEAIAAVCRGLDKAVAEGTALSGGIIITALRSLPSEHSLRMARLAKQFLWKGVVGFDIAGDEGSFPLALHEDAIRYAKQAGVPVTVHAGEWTEGTLANVELALALGVDRIGHGIVMAQCEATMARVAASGVTVEVCLSSNVKPWRDGAPKSVAEHPITQMVKAGVTCALSSDNIMLSGTHDRQAESVNELARLAHDTPLGWRGAKALLMNGAAGAFLLEAEKRAFVERYRKALDAAWSAHVEGGC